MLSAALEECAANTAGLSDHKAPQAESIFMINFADYSDDSSDEDEPEPLCLALTASDAHSMPAADAEVEVSKMYAANEHVPPNIVELALADPAEDIVSVTAGTDERSRQWSRENLLCLRTSLLANGRDVGACRPSSFWHTVHSSQLQD
jgi:hypothetical protein